MKIKKHPIRVLLCIVYIFSGIESEVEVFDLIDAAKMPAALELCGHPFIDYIKSEFLADYARAKT